jgi:hypothetical protein
MLSLNGKTTYGGVRLSIYWTGQNAEHVSENHSLNPERRPGIQKTQSLLQRSDNYRLANGRIMGLVTNDQGTYRIIWEKKSTFAVIKTSEKFNTTPKKLLKSKGIGKVSKQKTKLTEDDVPSEEKRFAKENNIPIAEYVKILNKHLQKKKR